MSLFQEGFDRDLTLVLGMAYRGLQNATLTISSSHSQNLRRFTHYRQNLKHFSQSRESLHRRLQVPQLKLLHKYSSSHFLSSRVRHATGSVILCTALTCEGQLPLD